MKQAAPKSRTTNAVPVRSGEVQVIVAALRRMATKKYRDGLARFAIPADKAFGVPVGKLQKYAKRLKAADKTRSHLLAAALWETGWYEARMLACFLDDPLCVTPAQMDRWCRDFDSWAIVDTACFHLFDRTPHAFRKVKEWSRREGEFQKRASFALLASMALHDKETGDEPFADCLPLIERAATDERNFVKKGVSWALRGLARRSRALHAAAVALAQRLADSTPHAARWVGKDALRDITKPAVVKRLKL